jgi:hypothetical protein
VKIGSTWTISKTLLIGPDPDTTYIYFWNPHKKHYKSALGIISRLALPAKRWTRVGDALISQLADIERGRDEWIRSKMATPVCARARFDSMGCGCKSACCKRISRVTGHLWTGLRNSGSSPQITGESLESCCVENTVPLRAWQSYKAGKLQFARGRPADEQPFDCA